MAKPQDPRSLLLTKVLRPGDEGLLVNAAPALFGNAVDVKLTAEFLADPRHHMAVALNDRLVVVAFASAVQVHYVHPHRAPQLWINEVAVAPPYRHLGLGKALLRELLEVGRIHECTLAWALTNRANAPAKALYSSVGGIEWANDDGPADGTLGYTFTLRSGIRGPHLASSCVGEEPAELK